jgi:hypothetical protein
VVGAISLFGESPFRLPVEERISLEPFRGQIHGRLGEISLPAAAAGERQHEEISAALLHFALSFGSTYCHFDSFVAALPPDWAERKQELLQFQPLTSHGSELLVVLTADAAIPCRHACSAPVSYTYPEKKYFMLAHQYMPADVFGELFREDPGLFGSLTELELRILRNIYDFSPEHAKALPAAREKAHYRNLPKHRRHPMNCEGYLCVGNGERLNLTVLDVSREGLKIRAEEPLVVGHVYPLTVSIGVKRQAEVIACAVWVDEVSQTAGLAVKSGDQSWEDLVQYLEAGSVLTG